MSGTAKARNFKFGKQIGHWGPNEKNAKLGQKGPEGVTWPTFRILGPIHISGTVEGRNFKFGMQIVHGGPKRNNAKLGQKGREGVTWPTSEILGPPLYLRNCWS